MDWLCGCLRVTRRSYRCDENLVYFSIHEFDLDRQVLSSYDRRLPLFLREKKLCPRLEGVKIARDTSADIVPRVLRDGPHNFEVPHLWQLGFLEMERAKESLVQEVKITLSGSML